jgi:hypothetical protein
MGDSLGIGSILRRRMGAHDCHSFAAIKPVFPRRVWNSLSFHAASAVTMGG